MTDQIVKIQRPMFPVNAPFLIYDEKRHHTTQVPEHELPDHVRSYFTTSEELKAYFFAVWTQNRWAVGSKTGDQKW